MATKLMYVGDGRRYLNGVPAADFETDDEALIAECLASDLYVEIKAKTKEPEKEPPARAAKAEAPAEAQTTPAE